MATVITTQTFIRAAFVAIDGLFATGSPIGVGRIVAPRPAPTWRARPTLGVFSASKDV